MKIRNSFGFVFFAFSFLPTLSFAQNVLTNKNKIAVSSYDVVSYFDSKPLKGKTDFTAMHEGASYQFATAENRDKFSSNPVKYTPQYGGWCAYGWSQGYPAKIDPEAWTIVADKLYLNYDKGVKKTWDKDQSGYIQKANANWAKKLNGQ